MGIEELPGLRLVFLFHRKHLRHTTKKRRHTTKGMFHTRSGATFKSQPMYLFTRNPAPELNEAGSTKAKRIYTVVKSI